MLNSLGFGNTRQEIFVGITRDSNRIWRRTEDQQEFTTTNADWRVGWPKPNAPRIHLYVTYDPNNGADHGLFVNRLGSLRERNSICEYLEPRDLGFLEM